MYYKVYWSVNATHLRMALQANTTGWIGIGISGDGSMHNNYKGSDIYVAYPLLSAARVAYSHANLSFYLNGNLSTLHSYNWANATSTNRTPQVHDYWTTEHDLPKKDTSQDITLVNFDTKNGLSTYEIVRKLVTGDASDTDISPTARTRTLHSELLFQSLVSYPCF